MLALNILQFFVLGVGYFFVWRFESRKLVVITPFVFVIYFIWIRIYPAFLVSGQSLTGKDYFFIYATVAVALFLIGFLFSAYYKRARVGYTARISRRVSDGQYRADEFDWPIAVLTIFLTAVSLYFYQGFPDVFEAVVLQLVSDNNEYLAVNIRDLRFEQTKGAYFGEEARGQGLIRALMTLGWPVVTAYHLVKVRAMKSTRARIYSAVVISLSFVFILSIGSRGPTLTYFMMLLCSISVARPLKLRVLVYGAIGIVGAAVVLGAFSTKMNYLIQDPSWDSINRASAEIAERIFLGNAGNDIRVIELVEDNRWSLQWGRENLRNFITALPGVQYGKPLAYELYLAMTPDATGTTFMTGTYISILFVDFGVAGMALGYLLLGVIVGGIQRIYFNMKGNPLILAALAGPVFYSVAHALISGISGLLAKFVVLFIIAGMLLVLCEILRGRNRTRTSSVRRT